MRNRSIVRKKAYIHSCGNDKEKRDSGKVDKTIKKKGHEKGSGD